MNDLLAHPRLARIFRLLRDGRHLCIDDGELFTALEQHTEAFSELFRALGYRLGSHRKGIYYFVGDNPLTDTARRFSVFTFILIEHLGDAGDGIEEALFTEVYRLEELPHLQSDRYRETLAELGVVGDDDLRSLLKSMERYGFVELLEDRVRFRRPLYRLVDLCVRVLEAAEEAEA